MITHYNNNNNNRYSYMLVSYSVLNRYSIKFLNLLRTIILNEVICVPGAYPVTGFPARAGGGAAAEAVGSHSVDVDVV